MKHLKLKSKDFISSIEILKYHIQYFSVSVTSSLLVAVLKKDKLYFRAVYLRIRVINISSFVHIRNFLSAYVNTIVGKQLGNHALIIMLVTDLV